MNLSIKHLNAPQNLESGIFLAINHHERFNTKLKLAFQSAIAVVSFGAFFPLGSSLIQAFTNSNFSEYVSILFSGDSAFINYWQELTLSIVESLPVLSLTLFLAVGVVFLYSLTRALRNGRQFLLLTPNI